jgi:hypothetical protein
MVVGSKRKQFLWQVCMEIYRKMYRHSRPPADFDKLIAKKETLKSGWYMGYYLRMDRQEDIIQQVCKSHGLSKREIHMVSKEVHLGSSPNTSLETWKDFRKVKKGG